MEGPITAIGALVALHVASVLHGIDTTVTLPPHYLRMVRVTPGSLE